MFGGFDDIRSADPTYPTENVDSYFSVYRQIDDVCFPSRSSISICSAGGRTNFRIKEIY
jgi:hypothetical protein